MKPVAIFRHSPQVGPGYFAEFLAQQGIPYQLVAVDEGDNIPEDVSLFSGLCFMGGPMSVNDPLPWIAPELALIRCAVANNVPVIGHCLGGQLMSKALGGYVDRNPVKEIGWSLVQACETTEARRWMGDAAEYTVYQWHGERFAIPPGAVRILSNATCENQAFVLGPHLAMQCHVEMTEPLIRDWNRDWATEFDDVASLPESVQTPETQFRRLSENLAAMRLLTRRLYAEWINGLHHD